MLAVALVYAGFAMVVLGVTSMVVTPTLLGIVTPLQAALILVAGLVVSALGLFLPARETHVRTLRTHLDEFAPVYQFNEIHKLQVRAPRDRVYKAIKSVTADEILFFRPLTWIRRFGKRDSEDIFNPPKHVPLLEVATRTEFSVLAEEVDREIVIGTVLELARARLPAARLKAYLKPEHFRALDAPLLAKAVMNFRLEDAEPGTCSVTTETRVYATDVSARLRCGAYWRIIRPGSALLRRTCLRAVKLRAEAESS